MQKEWTASDQELGRNVFLVTTLSNKKTSIFDFSTKKSIKKLEKQIDDEYKKKVRLQSRLNFIQATLDSATSIKTSLLRALFKNQTDFNKSLCKELSEIKKNFEPAWLQRNKVLAKQIIERIPIEFMDREKGTFKIILSDLIHSKNPNSIDLNKDLENIGKINEANARDFEYLNLLENGITSNFSSVEFEEQLETSIEFKLIHKIEGMSEKLYAYKFFINRPTILKNTKVLRMLIEHEKNTRLKTGLKKIIW